MNSSRVISDCAPRAIRQRLRQHASFPLRTACIPSSSCTTTHRYIKREQRCAFHGSNTRGSASHAPPRSKDRGPVSQEDTQTDFNEMNVLNNTVAPSTSIDACLDDGFQLNNGLKITGGSGVLLMGGEAFSWRPWTSKKGRLINGKGQWECGKDAWGILDLVWPKPDLLILGLGPHTYPISRETREHISSLGIRVDILDTRNAAAQFNLLATERGIENVAAALLPMGWRDHP